MNLIETIADVVWWNNEMETSPCPSGGGLGDAMDKMVDSAKKDTAGTWEVFRSGTNEEFAALVNCLGELGDEFDSDDAMCEVMRMAKARGSDEVMNQTRAGFGVLFERFFDEAEPTGTAQTFGEIING